MTFKSIDPVMETGVKRQLEFSDLLQLPEDMEPSCCYNLLHNCWKAEQRNNSSNPSLLKAIFSAYGWPYFRLGLLKVFLSASVQILWTIT